MRLRLRRRHGFSGSDIAGRRRRLRRGAGTLALVAATTLAGSLDSDAVQPGQNGRLVFSNLGELRIASPPFPGGSLETVRSAPDAIEPAWSPDRRWIAFTHRRLDGFILRFHLWILDVARGQAHALATADECGSPAWRGDSRFLVAVCPPEGPRSHIVTIGVGEDGQATSQARALTDSSFLGSKFDPTWSPDGARIGFVGQRAGDSSQEVYSVRSDGSDPMRLTNNQRLEYDPSWSPDGQRLAYSSRDPNGFLRIMELGVDSVERELIVGSRNLMEPAWSPDGCEMALIEDSAGSSAVRVVNICMQGGGLRYVDSGHWVDWETVRAAAIPTPAPTNGPSATSAVTPRPSPILVTPEPEGASSSPRRTAAPLPQADSSSRAEVIPPTVDPGDRVTLRGEGFAPNAGLRVEIQNGSPTELGEGSADETGRYQLTAAVPEDTHLGEYRVDVTGRGRGGGTHDSYGELTVGVDGAIASQVVDSESGSFAWWIVVVAIAVAAALVLLIWRTRSRQSGNQADNA